MTGFPTNIRTRPEVLHLDSAGSPGSWTIRVQAADVWDSVRVECLPGTTVAQVKAAAMRNLLPDVRETALFMVKFHGGEVRSEALTLEQIGMTDSGMLFLAPRHRRPIR